jgi:hypothetical protein
VSFIGRESDHLQAQIPQRGTVGGMLLESL